MRAEDRFVQRLRALLPPSGRVSLPPGDDAAIVAHAEGPLAATTDMLVEGVDFFAGEDPERLGRRSVAVNLSDLAAVGARPEFFLLSIAFPRALGEEFPLSVARGAIARAAEFGAQLVGGDLSAAPQTVVCVALWGPPVAAPITRSGAAPGDGVYISGYPGEAAAGLRLARVLAAFSEQGAPPTQRFPEMPDGDERRLLDAFRDPIPRVPLGMALARHGLASAAIDLSDGMGVDADRLARASGVRVVLDRDRLPFSAALVAFAAMDAVDPVELLLGGGDDYELLFTVPEDDEERIPSHAADFGVPITRIGRVEKGSGAVLRDRTGERNIADLGHDHLETPR